MNVKKIFIILITVVACVMLGAFILNILFPNVATSLVNSVEDMIFKATNMSFDFNGDGNMGDQNANNSYTGNVNGADSDATGGAGVEGFN